MANVYGHNIWKLDTAGVISHDRLRVKKMEFLPNAASDDLVVVDDNGEDVWRVTNALAGGRAGLEAIDFSEGQDVDGLNVSTLGASCVLTVYLK